MARRVCRPASCGQRCAMPLATWLRRAADAAPAAAFWTMFGSALVGPSWWFSCRLLEVVVLLWIEVVLEALQKKLAGCSAGRPVWLRMRHTLQSRMTGSGACALRRASRSVLWPPLGSSPHHCSPAPLLPTRGGMPQAARMPRLDVPFCWLPLQARRWLRAGRGGPAAVWRAGEQQGASAGAAAGRCAGARAVHAAGDAQRRRRGASARNGNHPRR